MSQSQRFSLSSVLLSALSLSLTGLLAGCTLAADAPITGAAFHGVSYAAGQPVVGQHVYLMAATVSGVGPAGYGVASTSLLSAAQTGNSDSIGAYVLTAAGTGGFRITGDYICPSATTQVYIYGLGGNPGAGTNSASSMMAALGSCGSLSSSSFVYMSELSTVAAAYSLSGFATDALHVSVPQYVNATQQTNNITDALAQTDLQNAFANVNNLVNIATGVAQTTTPAGNGTPVTAQVITLGNILAACVNASDAAPTNCTTLFSNALSGGSTGSTPTETATAAINIAHHPYVSANVMMNLYALQPATGAPFAGGDTAQPTDFTVSITFTGGSLNVPQSIAIDGSGNAWVANSGNSTVSEFSPSGTALSSTSGYTGGGLDLPVRIAIDIPGNAWVTNLLNNSVSEFSSIGMAVSSSSGYTGGGLSSPFSIAIDGSGNAWVTNHGTNSISELSSSGTAVSSSSGYTGGGLNVPYKIAIDVPGNAWVANQGANSISEFSASGTAISSASGYTGGGLNAPYGLAIDGSGNIWVVSPNSNDLSEFSSSGVAISSSSGYTGGGLNAPISIAIDGSGNIWAANYGNNSVSLFSSSGTAISSTSGYTAIGFNVPYSIAIDGSGNVWVANNGSNSITELVGAATPVVTSLPANLIAPYASTASRP